MNNDSRVGNKRRRLYVRGGRHRLTQGLGLYLLVVAVPVSPAIARGGTQADSPSLSEIVQRERERVRTERERKNIFGIRPGMTRDDVEHRLASKGLERFAAYSVSDISPEAIAGGESFFWVLEYRYRTEHFSHILKVFLRNETGRVHKVAHTAENIP